MQGFLQGINTENPGRKIASSRGTLIKLGISVLQKDNEVFFSPEEHFESNVVSQNDIALVKESHINIREKYNSKPIVNSRKFDYYEKAYDSKRDRLPVKRVIKKLNVWSILKDAVGKDLNKFCVPGKITLLSLLQRAIVYATETL